MSFTIINNNNIFQREEIGKVRSAQEDSHDIATFTPNGDVFVVCDGMGGHVGGKTASTIAVKSIIEYLKKEKYLEPLRALDEALQFANIQILGYADEHPELKGMGTTACIVLLQDTKAYIAHVGDSRIYLYLGKEKQLHRITKDHSYVQALVDAGEISDEEAESHPNKNRILKALGIRGDLRPSLNTVQPKKGDVFLICSDGLSGMVTDVDMERILQQRCSLERRGNELIDTALENGGLDNVTLELIEITTSPYARSTFKSYNPPNRNQKPIYNSQRKKWMVGALAVILLGILWNPIINIGIKYEKTKIYGLRQEMGNIEKQVKKKIDSLRIDEIIKKDTLINSIKANNNLFFDNMKGDTIKPRELLKNLQKQCDDFEGMTNNGAEKKKLRKEVENLVWQYFLTREKNAELDDIAALTLGKNGKEIVERIIGVGTKDKGLLQKYKEYNKELGNCKDRVKMLNNIKITRE